MVRKILNIFLAQVQSSAHQALYKKLEQASSLIETTQAGDQSKLDALRIVDTFKFVLCNEEYIKTVVERGFENSEERPNDKTNGVIRDHRNTSFHLNAYQKGQAGQAKLAFDSLVRIAQQFSHSLEIAQQYKLLDHSIDLLKYDEKIGCLEARVAKFFKEISEIQSTNGIQAIDDLIAKQYEKDPDASYENLQNHFATQLGQSVRHEGQIFPLTFELIQERLTKIYQIEEPSEVLELVEAFTPSKSFDAIIASSFAYDVVGKTGMLQYRFPSIDSAQSFKEWLKSQDALKGEQRLHQARIDEQTSPGEFIVRLTKEQKNKIDAASEHMVAVQKRLVAMSNQASTSSVAQSTAIVEMEQAAEKALLEPFFAKTIAKNSGAVKATFTAVTRLPGENVRFRELGYNKRYRVRLNPKTEKHEIHDVQNPDDQLFKEEKKLRQQLGQIPNPPHHSFSYYNPLNERYKTNYFDPQTANSATRDELFGMRVAAKGPKASQYNRLIVTDVGTYFRIYGFPTLQQAQKYIRDNADRYWAKNLDDLEKKTMAASSRNHIFAPAPNIARYNEAMVRAQWCCDGSSQVVIYPPYDSINGRYAAILYALDLENRLEAHRDIYQNEPVCWKPGYKVPISFWGNDAKDLKLYKYAEQLNDLEKPATGFRGAFLKMAIYFMKSENCPHEVVDEFQEQYKKERNRLNNDHLFLFDWVSGATQQAFYEYLYDSVSEEFIENTLSNSDIEKWNSFLHQFPTIKQTIQGGPHKLYDVFSTYKKQGRKPGTQSLHKTHPKVFDFLDERRPDRQISLGNELIETLENTDNVTLVTLLSQKKHGEFSVFLKLILSDCDKKNLFFKRLEKLTPEDQRKVLMLDTEKNFETLVNAIKNKPEILNELLPILLEQNKHLLTFDKISNPLYKESILEQIIRTQTPLLHEICQGMNFSKQALVQLLCQMDTNKNPSQCIFQTILDKNPSYFFDNVLSSLDQCDAKTWSKLLFTANVKMLEEHFLPRFEELNQSQKEAICQQMLTGELDINQSIRPTLAIHIRILKNTDINFFFTFIQNIVFLPRALSNYHTQQRLDKITELELKNRFLSNLLPSKKNEIESLVMFLGQKNRGSNRSTLNILHHQNETFFKQHIVPLILKLEGESLKLTLQGLESCAVKSFLFCDAQLAPHASDIIKQLPEEKIFEILKNATPNEFKTLLELMANEFDKTQWQEFLKMGDFLKQYAGLKGKFLIVREHFKAFGIDEYIKFVKQHFTNSQSPDSQAQNLEDIIFIEHTKQNITELVLALSNIKALNSDDETMLDTIYRTNQTYFEEEIIPGIYALNETDKNLVFERLSFATHVFCMLKHSHANGLPTEKAHQQVFSRLQKLDIKSLTQFIKNTHSAELRDLVSTPIENFDLSTQNFLKFYKWRSAFYEALNQSITSLATSHTGHFLQDYMMKKISDLLGIAKKAFDKKHFLKITELLITENREEERFKGLLYIFENINNFDSKSILSLLLTGETVLEYFARNTRITTFNSDLMPVIKQLDTDDKITLLKSAKNNTTTLTMAIINQLEVSELQLIANKIAQDRSVWAGNRYLNLDWVIEILFHPKIQPLSSQALNGLISNLDQLNSKDFAEILKKIKGLALEQRFAFLKQIPHNQDFSRHLNWCSCYGSHPVLKAFFEILKGFSAEQQLAIFSKHHDKQQFFLRSPYNTPGATAAFLHLVDKTLYPDAQNAAMKYFGPAEQAFAGCHSQYTRVMKSANILKDIEKGLDKLTQLGEHDLFKRLRNRYDIFLKARDFPKTASRDFLDNIKYEQAHTKRTPEVSQILKGILKLLLCLFPPYGIYKVCEKVSNINRNVIFAPKVHDTLNNMEDNVNKSLKYSS